MSAGKLTRQSVQLLYRKHGAALAAYACSQGLDFASAEDMVQQIFLKLLEGSAMPIEAPVPYLYRAVRNASLNLRRDRRHEAQLPEDLWLTHHTADKAEIYWVQRALRELPEEQRDAVFLKIWGGLTFQEIADSTATSINTAASRYRYGLEKLTEVLSTRYKAKEQV